MFERPFPQYPGLATTMFVGSTAGGVLIAPSNAFRTALVVQGLTDGVRVSPIGSLTGSSLLCPSVVAVTLPLHSGAVYAAPNGGATAPISIWESVTGP